MVATRRTGKSSNASDPLLELGKGEEKRDDITNNTTGKTIQSPKRRSARLRSASHDSSLTSPATRRRTRNNATNDTTVNRSDIKQSLSVTKGSGLTKQKVGRPRSKSVPSLLEAKPTEGADEPLVLPVVASKKACTKKSTSEKTSSRPTQSLGLPKDNSNSERTSRKRSASVASASSFGSTVATAKADGTDAAIATTHNSKLGKVTSSDEITNTSKGLTEKRTDETKTAAPVAKSLTAVSQSKIATISAEKIKHRMQKKKAPRNELTSFIPGYTAALRLDSSSLDNQRPGLESLRKRALTTDKSTAAFVKGTMANRQQTKIIVSSTKLSSSMSKSSSALISSSFKMGTKWEAPNNAGDKWFGMVPTPLTDDVKRDLNVIRSRNYLDPKRFYKSSDKAGKYIQVGTVIEGNTEYNSSRLTKKQRRGNLTEELMADPATADYAKRKYKKMQQDKSATHKKQNNFKKRGKRQHL